MTCLSSSADFLLASSVTSGNSFVPDETAASVFWESVVFPGTVLFSEGLAHFVERSVLDVSASRPVVVVVVVPVVVCPQQYPLYHEDTCEQFDAPAG